MKPIAWIKIRELSYMQAVAEHATEWKTNLGLNPEPDDEGLYTETQVQKMRESFEQSVTDPENQPSQYGTVLMKEWQGLTDTEVHETEGYEEDRKLYRFARAIEAKLKEKNAQVYRSELEAAVKAAVLAEREACARVCEKEQEDWGWDANVANVAIAIRARGEKK